MRRLIADELSKWKNGLRRKPLILRGARKVGKTWSLKAFGASQFESLALVDLERNPALRRVFDGDLSARRIRGQAEYTKEVGNKQPVPLLPLSPYCPLNFQPSHLKKILSFLNNIT